MIFTSRFANPRLKSGGYSVYGICRTMPKYVRYPVSGNIQMLAPNWRIFREYDREKFDSGYRHQLEEIGIDRVMNALFETEDDRKDVVLCCYEDVRDPNQFCHRTVLAEWIEEKTGIRIKELDDPSIPKFLKEQMKRETEAEKEKQISFWG